MTQPRWGRLAEQERIVDRLEEVLQWGDAPEAQSQQTRTLGAHLLNSTLYHPFVA